MSTLSFPNRATTIDLLQCIRVVLFPNHFGPQKYAVPFLQKKMESQIKKALKQENRKDEAAILTEQFFISLDSVREKLYIDAQAGFDGDPAAYSLDEVILTYPGFYAVLVHRVAHELYKEKIPYIPRIMAEYAHSRTGIDIHPGATIGESFFIDHGTGVVIGETTLIGARVKIYQGVTLGALSTRGGQRLKNVRRHPTIKDNVTIYAGATILGGETIIGEDSVIGGNVFVTESVSPNSKIFFSATECEKCRK